MKIKGIDNALFRSLVWLGAIGVSTLLIFKMSPNQLQSQKNEFAQLVCFSMGLVLFVFFVLYVKNLITG